MERYEGCTSTRAEGGTWTLYDVAVPEGVFAEIYLSPGGLCAVIPANSDHRLLYSALRRIVGVVNMRLYVQQTGRYEPYSGAVEPLLQGPDSMADEIYTYLTESVPCHTEDGIEHMRKALITTDAYTRGYYRDETGALYLFSRGRFQRASDLDPEHLFTLMVTGGFLGLHRFAMGKFFSGILYLITCGFFLVGWFMDLLQLFTGTLRDRFKGLVPPLTEKSRKLPKLFLGLLAGIIALALYLQLLFGVLEYTDLKTTPSEFGNSISDRLIEDLAELPDE